MSRAVLSPREDYQGAAVFNQNNNSAVENRRSLVVSGFAESFDHFEISFAMTSGSPLWQMVFLSFACVFILFEVVRGWRLGCDETGDARRRDRGGLSQRDLRWPEILPILRAVLEIPDIVISLLAGAILALVVYFAISTIGKRFFSSAADEQISKPCMYFTEFAARLPEFFSASSRCGSLSSAFAR